MQNMLIRQCHLVKSTTLFCPIFTRTFSVNILLLQENKNNKSNDIPLTKQISWKGIEPQVNKIKLGYERFHTQLDKCKKQMSIQMNTIKESIQAANKKIEEQERESADLKLNFKKDAETSNNIVGLPSERESHRKKWKRKLEFYLDSLQETIFTATRALNDVTGYSSIQKLRNSITVMERELDIAKKNVKDYKEQYSTAIEMRTKSQRDLNELLQIKSSWSPKDLKRFTDLYQADASNMQKEQQLKIKLNDLEVKETKLEDELYRAILTRYHEEQIWSDKIRRTSTWGTFLLMGMNIILFLVFQLLLEPWKRRRLTRSFEDKVKTALDEYTEGQEKHNLAIFEQKENSTALPTNNSNYNMAIESVLIDDNDLTTESKIKKSYIAEIKSIFLGIFVKLKNLNNFKSDSNVTFGNLEFYIYSSCLLMFGGIISTLIGLL